MSFNGTSIGENCRQLPANRLVMAVVTYTTIIMYLKHSPFTSPKYSDKVTPANFNEALTCVSCL